MYNMYTQDFHKYTIYNLYNVENTEKQAPPNDPSEGEWVGGNTPQATRKPNWKQ